MKTNRERERKREQREIGRDIEMCVGKCREIDRVGGRKTEREGEREAVLGRPGRRSVPVFEIPLTAKAISWRWLCCQLLGWLAVKYGGWESAASSPRQPDGWSPRGEEQQQEEGEEGGGKRRVGEGRGGETTEKQNTKKSKWGGGRENPNATKWAVVVMGRRQREGYIERQKELERRWKERRDGGGAQGEGEVDPAPLGRGRRVEGAPTNQWGSRWGKPA